MLKEELITSLLKSKDSIAELFNNNLDDGKIRDIKRTKKYRNEIKEKLYEIENKKNLSKRKKEKNDEYIRKLVRILYKKEEYCHHERDDLDYYGIREVEFYLMRLMKKTITNQYQ